MSQTRRSYPFHLIEPKWQQFWDQEETFRAFNPGEALPPRHPFAVRHGLAGRAATMAELPPKYYILDMFPYPSGAGLHVGHPEGYTATDILARYRRARGWHVLHPIGWDAFGLPAEQYAVKTGRHPRETTEANIATFKRQIKSLGFSYDWSREVDTTDPGYFKWTQWIFLQIYNSYFDPEWNKAAPIALLEDALSDEPRRPAEWTDNAYLVGQHIAWQRMPEDQRRLVRPRLIERSRLAYVAEMPVWWCEQLGTVLANEEVIDGKSEVGGYPAVRKPMRQWMLRITAYAERLLEDLSTIDWSDSLKQMQRNWIGRSEGAEVDFQVDGSSEKIRVFTTRPDTLFGATYMVLAPEHRIVDQIIPESWPCEVPPMWIQGVPETKGGEAVTDRNIATKRATQFGAEVVDLSRLEIPADVLALIPWEAIRRHRVIPLSATPTTVTVVLADPSDVTALDELHSALKRDLSVFVATPADIEAAIHRYYRPSPREAVASYRAYAASKSDLERTELAKEKTGVFTGAYAINPVNNERIPIWIADYVLISYGTGAIMAVPAHDTRDFEFATRFHLPILQVVQPPDPRTDWRGFVDDGTSVNSTGPEVTITGLPTPEAKEKITAWLESKGLGKKTINYKLRDWLFSRQRYWGEPFPVVWKRDAQGILHHEALPESALPVLPPRLDDYKPTAEGQPPLARAQDWVNLPDGAQRETNTMPQWAGSCWYYLRYLDATNAQSFVGDAAERYWMGQREGVNSLKGETVESDAAPAADLTIRPFSDSTTPGVDLYVGGTEHAVLHLLYARFWHKVLFDLGHVSTPEPFFKLVNQGLILGEDGQKMSKARGNVVNPDDMVKEFGADSLRLYEMFMGPLEMVKPWSTKGVEGVYRFLGRVWRLFVDEKSETDFEQAATTAAVQGPELLERIHLSSSIQDTQPAPAQLKALHACIKKVTEDLDGMRFNTAISALMVFVNEAMGWDERPASVLRTFLQLLAPFAPHVAEELWAKLEVQGSKFKVQGSAPLSLTYSPWPAFDPALLVESTLEIPVQVNGKLRGVVTVPAEASQQDLERAALECEKARPFLEAKTVKKIIVVPRKLVNIVAV